MFVSAFSRVGVYIYIPTHTRISTRVCMNIRINIGTSVSFSIRTCIRYSMGMSIRMSMSNSIRSHRGSNWGLWHWAQVCPGLREVSGIQDFNCRLRI